MEKTNCVYFCADRPCLFHKEKGIICESCGFFKPLGVKVLVIKLGALGDVLRTTSIIKPLVKKYSKEGLEPRISWVTYAKSLPVLENIVQINESLPYDAVTLTRLLIEKFDLMLNLDLAPEALALAGIVKATEKKGFGLDSDGLPVYLNPEAMEWFEMSHNDRLKKANKKTYQEHILRIAGAETKNADNGIMLNLNKQEKKFAEDFSKKHLKGKGRPVIGLNTGGGGTWEKKEWPADSTSVLIKLLNKKGIHGAKPAILLFGGEKEAKRNARIVKEAGNKVINTGTKNTPREFFALLDLCDAVVATDTLALHASLALGKKTAALFGPTSPVEIEMYGLGKKITAPVDCTVCYRRVCAQNPDCMSSISPETVYNSILQITQAKTL